MTDTTKQGVSASEALRFLREAADAMDQAHACLRSAGLEHDVTTLKVGFAGPYLKPGDVHRLILQLATETECQIAAIWPTDSQEVTQ